MRLEKAIKWKKALEPYYDKESGLYMFHCPYCYLMFKIKMADVQGDMRHRWYCGKVAKLEDFSRKVKKWKWQK